MRKTNSKTAAKKTTAKKATSTKTVTAKKSSTVKKSLNRETITVSAVNPKTGKTVKSFASIREAARWVQGKRGTTVTSKVATIAASISSTSLGRESRSPNHVRNVAYGYAWKR